MKIKTKERHTTDTRIEVGEQELKEILASHFTLLLNRSVKVDELSFELQSQPTGGFGVGDDRDFPPDTVLVIRQQSVHKDEEKDYPELLRK